MKIRCFEFKDDGLEPDEVEEKINEELRKRNVSADAVVSISQPTSYAVTRVFYRD